MISYLTALPNRDLVVAGHQQTTRDWWETRRPAFDLVASQLVIQEARQCNVTYAQNRLREIPLLSINEAAISLAETFVNRGPLPQKANIDALHIATAVTNGVEYLLTWNCKHIANANMRNQIERLCRQQGYEPTIICTPDQL